ncbi:hypothetical protein PRN20_16515 [Devosia sp. ZB163]|nr:hypothetical protein [Devosia sp. ZB163]MDC9825335.1 hypothetical protein [Devosia sp. ZB163]
MHDYLRQAIELAFANLDGEPFGLSTAAVYADRQSPSRQGAED